MSLVQTGEARENELQLWFFAAAFHLTTKWRIPVGVWLISFPRGERKDEGQGITQEGGFYIVASI